MNNSKVKSMIQNWQIKHGIDPYFTCFLCKNIVAPPHPIECSMCHSTFCQSCIITYTEELIKNSISEISSLQLFTCPKGCLYIQFIPLHVYAKHILDETHIQCPYEECNTVIKYVDYMQHVNEICGEVPIACSCGAKVKQKNKNSHD